MMETDFDHQFIYASTRGNSTLDAGVFMSTLEIGFMCIELIK